MLGDDAGDGIARSLGIGREVNVDSGLAHGGHKGGEMPVEVAEEIVAQVSREISETFQVPELRANLCARLTLTGCCDPQYAREA
jgi:hypothetical protein